jgi:hypothetical protein
MAAQATLGNVRASQGTYQLVIISQQFLQAQTIQHVPQTGHGTDPLVMVPTLLANNLRTASNMQYPWAMVCLKVNHAVHPACC